MENTSLQKKKVKLVPLVFMMYMFISGGAFGIEDMIGYAGPGITFVMLLVLPVVWAYPYGLICTEMGAKYTEDSGMYGWIKRALGKFPAYMAGWSMTLANYIDTAVYMVLSIEYLDSALGLGFTSTQKWLTGLAFIAVICILSLRGVEVLAASSLVSGIILLVPFLLTIVMAVPKLACNPLEPVFATGNVAEDVNSALLIGFWLFMGYESLHSFSDEVEGAGPLTTKAFLWAVPMAAFLYIVPTFMGLAVTGNWDQWSAEGPIDLIEMGRIVGGNFLMILFLVAAIFSNLGMYANYMAFGSRITFQMAEDGLFFKGLDKVHTKYGTPYVSIIVTAIITGVLTLGSFSELIVIDVMLLLVSIILMMISSIVLRFREEKDKVWDCFSIPVGNKLFTVIALLPTVIAVYAIATSAAEELAAGGICLAIGVVMYFVFPLFNKGKNNN